MQSPPARAIPNYFFKDHQPAGGEDGTLQKSSQGFNVSENCYNSQSPSAPRQRRIPDLILNLLTGVRFLGKPQHFLSRFRHQDAQTPPSPLVGEEGRGDAHRGRCFGKPLRASSCFRHQDAQTPSSPLVGEEGRGDAHRGRCFDKPLRASSCFRHQDAQTPSSPLVGV